MRHLLIFLLLTTPVFCWPKITTNFLGIPLDVVTMSAPGANYVPTYDSATNTWKAAAGGGGGTVTAVNGGTGISTGISGTTVTVTNTGVTSAVAGTGVSVSGATGAVTFGNTGVTSAVAGTGISVSGGTGAVTIGNTGVISVTAGTNVTLGGTAANPVINATGGTSNTTPTGFPDTSTVQKFLVPLYIYPTLAGWTNYYATSPKTGIVVANPSSGPGGSANSDYTTGIAGMHTNGIQVIGYVHTRVSPGGAFRVLATVEAEVDSWYSFYPTIDGIFFDEVDSVGGSTEVTYFTALWNYVRAKSTRNLVVLNPGTNTAEVYAGISDIIVTSENSYATYSGSYVVDAWTRKYPATHFCHIVHTCTPTNLPAAVNLTKENRAGYTYITDDPATYTVNPTYLTEAITSIGLVDGRFPMIYSGINGTTNVSPTSVIHINGTSGIVISHTQASTTEDVTATPTYGTAASTFTQGNDTRLPPTPGTAGKTIYDNGTNYVALAAGTSNQVYRGGSAPSWGTAPLASIQEIMALADLSDVSGVTGTGSTVALSVSPAFTGTVNTAALTVAAASVLTVTQDTSIPAGITVGLNMDMAAGNTVNVSWTNVSVSDGTQGIMLGTFSGNASCATAGSAINGRDQAGTFANNVWVYVYAISKVDGTVPALLLSQSATAPTYPTNYTKKSNPLAAFFTGGGTNSVRGWSWLNGREYYYSPVQVISAGTATTYTDLNTGSSSAGLPIAVPPQATTMGIAPLMTGTVVGSSGLGQYSYDGGTSTFATICELEVSGISNIAGVQVVPISGQHGYYRTSTASDPLTINVTGWGWSTQ